MSADIGVKYWMVTINGVPFRRGFAGEPGYRAAVAMAERWQGSHSGNRGLLKHKDKGDWVEVKRDYDTEKDTIRRFDEARRGNPQKYTMIHE